MKDTLTFLEWLKILIGEDIKNLDAFSELSKESKSEIMNIILDPNTPCSIIDKTITINKYVLSLEQTIINLLNKQASERMRDELSKE